MCRDVEQFDFLEPGVEHADEVDHGELSRVDRSLRLQTANVGETFSSIAAAKTSDELAAALGRVLIDECFDQFLVIRSDGFGEHRILVRSKPLPFVQWQQGGRGAFRDAMTDYAVTQGRPLTWIEAGADDRAGTDIQNYAAMASQCGLHNGVSIPILTADNGQHVFHLSRSSPDLKIDDQSAVWRLVSKCLVLSQRLHRIEQVESFGHAQRPNLSAREIEVLRWIKDGKSYAEIGQIINISSKTVEFHIANALRKLGVANRISAIIACSKHGFFDL